MLVDEPDYFGPRCFSNAAIGAFPELTTELTRDAELVHVQMGTLASAGRSAIIRGDTTFVHRLFAFLEDVLSHSHLHHEIPNAVATSFLLRADFERSNTGRRAWEFLPDRLKDVLRRTI